MIGCAGASEVGIGCDCVVAIDSLQETDFDYDSSLGFSFVSYNVWLMFLVY